MRYDVFPIQGTAAHLPQVAHFLGTVFELKELDDLRHREGELAHDPFGGVARTTGQEILASARQIAAHHILGVLIDQDWTLAKDRDVVKHLRTDGVPVGRRQYPQYALGCLVEPILSFAVYLHLLDRRPKPHPRCRGTHQARQQSSGTDACCQCPRLVDDAVVDRETTVKKIWGHNPMVAKRDEILR